MPNNPTLLSDRELIDITSKAITLGQEYGNALLAAASSTAMAQLDSITEDLHPEDALIIRMAFIKASNQITEV